MYNDSILLQVKFFYTVRKFTQLEEIFNNKIFEGKN